MSTEVIVAIAVLIVSTIVTILTIVFAKQLQDIGNKIKRNGKNSIDI
ncbi:MAG: hypothetical protein ABR503_04060 [Chitinophagaceae bacterium]